MSAASDVQPMLWIDDIETAIDWYRDRLGYEIIVFGHDASGRPNVCLASLDGAATLITREPALALGDTGPGSGHVRLYVHLSASVASLLGRVREFPDVDVAQGPTDQHWGDRTVILRDPWGTLLVFSNTIS